MEELSGIIADLLKKYNRVSLPGIGAFVATPVPAVIDKDTKTVYPPSKDISFSKAEVWNDGLLEARYAQDHQLEIEAAREQIKDLMMTIRFELDDKSKVILPGLGVLRQSPSRKLSFELNKNTNLESESFGLAPTHLTPMSKAMARLSGIPKTSLIIFVGMLLAVAFIGLYLSLSTPKSSDDLVKVLEFQDSEELMLDEDRENTEVPEAGASTGQDQGTAQDAPPASTAASKPAATKPAATTAPVATTDPAVVSPKPTTTRTVVPKTEYYVIISSFNTHEAAEMCVNNYKKLGYKGAKWLDAENGRYRVSAATCTTYAEAKKVAKQLESTVKDAWVLELKH